MSMTERETKLPSTHTNAPRTLLYSAVINDCCPLCLKSHCRETLVHQTPGIPQRQIYYYTAAAGRIESRGGGAEGELQLESTFN